VGAGFFLDPAGLAVRLPALHERNEARVAAGDAFSLGAAWRASVRQSNQIELTAVCLIGIGLIHAMEVA